MGVFDDYYGVKKNRDGFVSSVKRSGASMVGGLGEIYADVTGDTEHDNALTRFDDRVQANNPSEINSLQDIADSPWLAMKVAAGSAAGLIGPGLVGKGLGAAGNALKMSRLARTGEAINSFGAQTALAGLPSVRAIGEQQRLSGEDENDLLKYAASAAVGGIETKFGIQKMLGVGSNAPRAGLRQVVSEFGKSPIRTGLKTAGASMLGEGGEELLQNPVEQYAGFQDPTSPESLEQTAFGGAMGALGGLAFGAAGGARRGLQHRGVRNSLITEGYVEPGAQTPTDLLQGLENRDYQNYIAPIQEEARRDQMYREDPLAAAEGVGMGGGDLQGAINKNVGVNGVSDSRRAEMQRYYDSLAAEKTGRFAADPATGLERELTFGEEAGLFTADEVAALSPVQRKTLVAAAAKQPTKQQVKNGTRTAQYTEQLAQHLEDGVITQAQYDEDVALLKQSRFGDVRKRVSMYNSSDLARKNIYNADKTAKAPVSAVSKEAQPAAGVPAEVAPPTSAPPAKPKKLALPKGASEEDVLAYKAAVEKDMTAYKAAVTPWLLSGVTPDEMRALDTKQKLSDTVELDEDSAVSTAATLRAAAKELGVSYETVRQRLLSAEAKIAAAAKKAGFTLDTARELLGMQSSFDIDADAGGVAGGFEGVTRVPVTGEYAGAAMDDFTPDMGSDRAAIDAEGAATVDETENVAVGDAVDSVSGMAATDAEESDLPASQVDHNGQPIRAVDIEDARLDWKALDGTDLPKELEIQWTKLWIANQDGVLNDKIFHQQYLALTTEADKLRGVPQVGGADAQKPQAGAEGTASPAPAKPAADAGKSTRKRAKKSEPAPAAPKVDKEKVWQESWDEQVASDVIPKWANLSDSQRSYLLKATEAEQGDAVNAVVDELTRDPYEAPEPKRERYIAYKEEAAPAPEVKTLVKKKGRKLGKDAAAPATERPRFVGEASDTIGGAEIELRGLAHKDAKPGDVLISAPPGWPAYVSFDDAVRIAREGISSGEVKPLPYQVASKTGIAIGHAERVLKAAQKNDGLETDLKSALDDGGFQLKRTDDDGTRYQVVDRKTGAVAGGPYKNRVTARRAVDRLDNEYGGYRYMVKPVPGTMGPVAGGVKASEVKTVVKTKGRKKLEPKDNGVKFSQGDSFSKSKVTDPNGKLLTVYAGGRTPFVGNKFIIPKKSDEQRAYGEGPEEAAFFSDNVPYVKEYAHGKDENVVAVHLNMVNPLEIDYKGQEFRPATAHNAIEQAKSLGHDGVIMRGVSDNYQGGRRYMTTQYMVFDPSQIRILGKGLTGAKFSQGKRSGFPGEKAGEFTTEGMAGELTDARTDEADARVDPTSGYTARTYQLYAKDGTEVGYVILTFRPDGVASTLEDIELDSKYRKKGYAYEVLDSLTKTYGEIFIHNIQDEALEQWKNYGIGETELDSEGSNNATLTREGFESSATAQRQNSRRNEGRSESTPVQEGDNDLNFTLSALPDSPGRRKFIARAGALVLGAALPKGYAAGKFQDAARKGDLRGALQLIADGGSSTGARALAKRLIPLLPQNISVRVIREGVTYKESFPGVLAEAYGVASLDRENKKIIVYLRESTDPDFNGVTEETLLHETIHAVLTARYDHFNYYVPNKQLRGKKADPAIDQYIAVWKEFKAMVEADADAPAGAKNAAANPDEFITYAMTKAEVQDWMRKQKYQGRTLWQAFKDWVRRVLGMDAEPTWLDAALKVSNDVLDAAKADPADFSVSQKLLAKRNGTLKSAVTDAFKKGDVITFRLPHVDGNYYVTGVVGDTEYYDDENRVVDRVDGTRTRVYVTYQVGDQRIKNSFSQETLRKNLKERQGSSPSQYLQSAITTVPSALPAVAKFTESTAEQMLARAMVTAKDIGKRALNATVFMHDLVDIGVKSGLTSAKGFNDLMGAKDQIRNRLEERIDEIMSRASGLKDQPAAEQFIRDSTLQQKWGYGDAADPVFARRFNALSASAQDVVKDVFKVGQETYAEVTRLGEAEINNEYDELIKRYPKNAVEYEKERQRDLKRHGRAMPKRDGPYAPLKRFGDHVVVAKSKAYLDAEANNDQKAMDKLIDDKDGIHYVVEFFDTAGAADARRKQLEGLYPSAISSSKQESFKRIDELPWSGIAKIKTAIDGAPDTKHKEAMSRLATSLYLRMLSESSARKSELKRKGVAGAGDMFRAFASQGRSNAHFIASMTKTKDINRQITAMRNEAHNAPQGTRDDATRVLNEIVARYNQGLDYKETPWVDKALRASSLWMLLSSPAYYLQNATQTYMVTLPVLGGKYGDRAFTELNRAYGDVARFVGKMGSELDVNRLPVSAAEKKMLIDLRDKGKLDITIASDLGRWASGAADQGPIAKVVDKLYHAAGKVEALNRITTALAAYRLSSGNAEYAGDMVDMTQGNYAGNNAPRFFHANGAAKLMTQFRKYQLVQISLMGRLLHDSFKGASAEERSAARRALAWVFTQQAIFTGVKGLPIPAALWMIVAAVGGDDDKDWERNFRKWIGDDDLATLLIRGVPAWMGLDISNKIGMGNAFSILPYSDIEFSKKGYKEAVFGASGAFIGGMGGQLFDGLGKMADGNYYKGVEAMMPRGLRDGMAGWRLATEGVTTGRNDTVLSADEINVFDGLMKAVGLPTTKITKFNEARNDLYQLGEHFKARDSSVKDAYANAVKSGDTDEAAATRAEWVELQASKKRWAEEMAQRGLKNEKLLEALKQRPLSTLLKAPQEKAKREAPWAAAGR